jgi:hypothetical protein
MPTEKAFGKLSADDLKTLLSYVPLLFSEAEDVRTILQEKQDKILSPDNPKVSWCQFYELPAAQHVATGMVVMGLTDELKTLAESPNQIQAMVSIIDKFASDDSELSDEDVENFRSVSVALYAWIESIIRSLRSLMTYGLYLNDLIAVVRSGGSGADKALLSAVKIDPTVLGCPSVIVRISRAVMLDDQKFLGDVQRAMNGKLDKREQKTYQDMRLVLQVLHEAGAPALNADDLYTLFHEELNLVRSEVGDGDVKGALRQFAYQFMKQKAVSQK